MNMRPLGSKLGIEVSEVGHGLWGMGGWSGSSDSESLESLQLSLELGCNFFDSAWAYGDGKSDALLGDLIRRNRSVPIVAASKIPPKNLKWPASDKESIDDAFPRQHVLEYAERIREALGRDSIDLLQYHVWDDSWVASPGWVDVIEELKAKSLIKAFGISLNRWEPWNGLDAIKSGAVDVVQVIYNIFDQAPEDELFPLCKELGVGVISRVPLDEGSLGGKMTKETRFPADDWRTRYFGPENLPETIDRVERLKADLPKGLSLPEAAIRFILSNPTVSSTIIGMRKPEHVKDNISFGGRGPLTSSVIEIIRAHRWDREVQPWAN